MAKSKVGGSRAYIRGRIGADVYSIGKDGKGTRQQVVRSLAEQVSNPRTESQMFGRMVMSTVMQAVSALQPIIDHSFDGLPKGQPSISEFIRQNYALIKADATAHPVEGYVFGLNKYQEKGVLPGRYVISDGKAQLPSSVTMASNALMITLSADTLTVGGLRSALGLTSDGYITYVTIIDGGKVEFARLRVDPAQADATAITAENVASIFLQEGNVNVTISLSGTSVNIEVPSKADAMAWGAIVSEKENGAWIHSKCVLNSITEQGWPASIALPTYPTGAQQFLNGGDL